MPVTTDRMAEAFLLRCQEAERKFIACLWKNPQTGREAAREHDVDERSFSDDRLGFLFWYIDATHEQGRKLDIDSCLRLAVETDGVDLNATDYDWVYRLVQDDEPVPGAIADYAREVAQLARKREGEVADAINTLRDSGVDTESFIPPTDSLPKGSGPPWLTVAEIGAMPAYREGMRPIGTGFAVLDDALRGGFRPGCIYTLAGRTGSAKSTLALNNVRRVALNGEAVLLVKIEESPSEAAWRLHAATAQVDMRVLLGGAGCATGAERERLIDGWKLLRTLPIRVSDCRDLNGIQRIIRRHVARDGKLVVIDQLSGVHVEGAESGYQRATVSVNALRELAVDLHIPILVVCQVNRAAAKDTTRHLTCHDLRDSGEIENDSAAVILIDRARRPACDWRSAEPIYELDLHIGKSRYGPATDPEQPITLNWYPRWCRIEEPGAVEAVG